MASLLKSAEPHGNASMGIAEVLLERGLITSDHLSAAMELRRTEGLRLDRALVRLECIGEEDLLRVMSEQLGVPMVDLTQVQIDLDALRSLPPETGASQGHPAGQAGKRHARRGHQRPVRPLRVRRNPPADGPGDPAGAGARAGHPEAHQDPLRRRRRNARRDDEHRRPRGRPGRRQARPKTCWRWPRRPASSSWSTRSSSRPSTSGPATSTSSRTNAGSPSATASTACCTTRPCRRRSRGSRPPSSAASRSWPT